MCVLFRVDRIEHGYSSRLDQLGDVELFMGLIRVYATRPEADEIAQFLNEEHAVVDFAAVEISGAAVVDGFLLSCEGEVAKARHSWAWEGLDQLVTDHPEIAWNLIRDAIARSPTEEVLAVVAAGPLEDLLCRHDSSSLGELSRTRPAMLDSGNACAWFGARRGWLPASGLRSRKSIPKSDL